MLRPGKDKGIATPIPLGLAGLAATTFLLGVALIFQAPAGWAPYFTQALLVGGLAELLAGMWAFGYGDALAATVFSFVGVFYMWWGLSHLSVFGLTAATAANAIGMGLVLVVSAFVVFYLWIASFYESAAFNLTLLFLWIGFALMGIEMFTGVHAVGALGGLGAIISSLIAAYGSFAEIYNETSMEEVVPLGVPKTVRERSEHEEQERIRRLHPIEQMHPAGGGLHA